MAFTNEQMERYSRHIILQEVGVKGQKKLLNGKVLIIGAGGLGAPAAMYLAAAGVGTIGIVDADEVDLSNLQRQIIHGTADVGKAKVKSAKETMNAMNPDVTVNTYREFVTSENIMDLIKDYDFIIDGTDNFPAKFLINDACVMVSITFSSLPLSMIRALDLLVINQFCDGRMIATDCTLMICLWQFDRVEFHL
jgi:molybdopterin/thiamine biosynthesis adenylyltransferase